MRDAPGVRIVPLLAVVAVAVVLTIDASANSESAQACAPGYSPCLPVTGDLNCDDIPDVKKPVRVTGEDQYGLDADRDGLGCEVSGEVARFGNVQTPGRAVC